MPANQLLGKNTNRKNTRSITPSEYRYCIPSSSGHTDELIPCHVSYRREAGRSYTAMKPAVEYSTRSCHHNLGAKFPVSVPDLDTLDSVMLAKNWFAAGLSPVLDTITLSRVVKDLGIGGKVIPKVIKGRQYIAFSGYSGLRTLFSGTIYSAQNSKIVDMAIGTLGLKGMVRGGAILTFYITVPLTFLEVFLKGESGYALVGKLISDISKIGISTLIGYIAAAMLGGATAWASVPAGVVILVGVLAGVGLNIVDDSFQLTPKLIKALEKLDSIRKEAPQALRRAPP